MPRVLVPSVRAGSMRSRFRAMRTIAFLCFLSLLPYAFAAYLSSTPAAAALEAAFPSAAAGVVGRTQGVNPVRGNIISTSFSLFQQAAAAYSGFNQAFQPEIVTTSTVAGLRAAWMTGARQATQTQAAHCDETKRVSPLRNSRNPFDCALCCDQARRTSLC